MADEKAELEYKQAILEWKLRLGMAKANAAAAVIAASINPWPVPAIPMMALATAAGIGQVAALSAAKPVKAYASGGILSGGDLTGDKHLFAGNHREMILPLDEQAKLWDIIKSGNMGGGSQTVTIPVYLDGMLITTVVVNNINDRKALIRQNSVVGD